MYSTRARRCSRVGRVPLVPVVDNRHRQSRRTAAGPEGSAETGRPLTLPHEQDLLASVSSTNGRHGRHDSTLGRHKLRRPTCRVRARLTAVAASCDLRGRGMGRIGDGRAWCWECCPGRGRPGGLPANGAVRARVPSGSGTGAGASASSGSGSAAAGRGVARQPRGSADPQPSGVLVRTSQVHGPREAARRAGIRRVPSHPRWAALL